MNKAGGIISIIAGIFGVMAAIATLFVGGMGSAFKADGANQIMGFGWGGIVFSFLVIIFGALALNKTKYSGAAIIISSIFGVVLGGTLVAICMALSTIGGILTLFEKNENKSNYTAALTTENLGGKNKVVLVIFALAVAIVVLAIVGGNNKNNSSNTTDAAVESDNKPNVNDPTAELDNEVPSALSPFGELAEIFSYGSKNTDLQRDNKLKEIIGKTVQWQLPVYEVSKSGDEYKVQTTGTNAVGTFTYITTRNNQEKQIIEALKTGDTISFKGRIYDSSMRSLQIKPAILFSPIESEQLAQVPVKTESEANQVADDQQDQPVIGELQSTEPEIKVTENDMQQSIPTQESNETPNKKTTWIGNWGDDIVAIVNTEPCSNRDFLKQGYAFLITSSIPEARLKKPSDAFFVSDGRATTVIGCWFKKEGGLIHVKMKRKHDGKIWEVDNNLDDAAIWTSSSEGTETSQQDVLAEANKRINIVWNGATKEIRAALLPEQKEWLKQRETDCSLKATSEQPDNASAQATTRTNCMATMTEERTEILKQKFADMD